MQKKKAIELTGCDGQQPKILERQRERERQREGDRERERKTGDRYRERYIERGRVQRERDAEKGGR